MVDDEIESESEVSELDRPGPIVLPYEPFLPFKDWLPSGFDFSTFDQYKRQLEEEKSTVDGDQLSDAVKVATRWAAANTGAIEGLYEVDRGFTYSVAVSASAWNDIHLVKGDSAAQHMHDALKAYDFVLDATTQTYPVNETWLRQIHEILTASQDTYTVLTAVGPQEQPLPRGAYKEHPNNPLNIASNTVHSYASPLETAAEMQRFVEQLRSKEFTSAHPIAQAAYAHYAFVCVHPFADGNGRVSRALASVYLYRNPGVPLVIFADQKGAYLDSLEAADRGEVGHFVRFLAERVIDTIGMVRAQISSALAPPVEIQMRELAPILAGKDGLAHTEIDAIASRLLDVVESAFEAQVDRNPLDHNLRISVDRVLKPMRQVQEGYRLVPSGPPLVSLTVVSGPPADGAQTRRFGVAVSKPGFSGPDFVVYSAGRVILSVDLREMHPTVSAALVFRAEAEALREIRESVAAVALAAQESLRAKGYL